MSKKIFFWSLPLFFILLSWSDTNNLDNNSTITDEIKTANQLMRLVNDYRQNIGKPLLIRCTTADKLAAEHTNYMISKNEVCNDNFEIRWEKLELKENANNIGENIGFDVSAEKAMTAYLNSVWLKVNVEGNFTHSGIAVKKDSKGRYYYTQIFYK